MFLSWILWEEAYNYTVMVEYDFCFLVDHTINNFIVFLYSLVFVLSVSVKFMLNCEEKLISCCFAVQLKSTLHMYGEVQEHIGAPLPCA